MWNTLLTKENVQDLPSKQWIDTARVYTNNLYQNIQPTNIDNITQDIQQQAYHEIDAVLSREDFKKSAQAFNNFLTLPQEIKDSFVAKINAKKWFDVWYIQKSREQWDTDNKQYFHYNLYTEELLADTIARYPEAQTFIHEARKIYLTSIQQIAQLLKTREQKYPGIYKLFIQQQENPHFFIRFLSYDINPIQDTNKDRSAKWHYDRWSMTIAHAESHPWLRIGSDAQSMQQVIHQDGKAKYFLSGYFPHLIIENYPKTLTAKQRKLLAQWNEQAVIQELQKEMPLWRHDVIQEETVTGLQKRRAIVAFFDAVHEEELSYDKTHTPK